MWTVSRLTLLGGVLLLAAPAVAQETRAPGATLSKRYQMERTEDGYLRLDRQTGAVSVCRDRAGTGWACIEAADEREAYLEEIERLASENEALQERLAALEESAPEVVPPPQEEGSLKLPSEEELDQVMSFFEGVMRRFFGIVERLRENVEPEPT